MKTSMQRNLIDLIHENTTITHLTAENHEQVIRALVDKLHEHGLVELEFANDVLAREETFPTGLPTEPHAVAIPHADPQHVRESAVGVAVLDRRDLALGGEPPDDEEPQGRRGGRDPRTKPAARHGGILAAPARARKAGSGGRPAPGLGYPLWDVQERRNRAGRGDPRASGWGHPHRRGGARP